MTYTEQIDHPPELVAPPAAAVAGVLFALLFATSVILVRAAVPAEPVALSNWTASTRSQISFALWLMPFAGVAFLWFLGVMRDHLGEHEDRFIATVSMGSALLFLAMTFMAFAIAASVVAFYPATDDAILTSDLFLLNRRLIDLVFYTYALKMAGVFMISLATLWRKTGTFPRALALITYLLALVLLVSLNLTHWIVLVFPAWTLLISVYMLVGNARGRRASSGAAD